MMADNITVTPGTGTTIATDDVGGVHVQRVKATWGVDGTATDVSASNPLPVSLASTPGLTDAQLRATPVPVSGPITDTQLRATAVPVSVSGTVTVSNPTAAGLTDAQLRASAVPVSLATAPALVAGSAVIGKVGIDQTTPGTTNKVSIGTDGTVALNAALPAGTNTIGGTVRVPSATQAMPSRARIASAASTNATSVKASAGGVYHIVAANMATSARFLKLYDKASAPTVGTDTPIATIYLPANGGFAELFDIPMGFTTGIAYAITALVADTDTTAVALNDIHGFILYA